MREFALPMNPVRSLTISFETLASSIQSKNYQPVIDDFKKIAEGCLQDGADTIIIGCGLFSPMFTLSGIVKLEDAPIIDPMIVSLKFAEIMVDFNGCSPLLKEIS
jgi:Asp/Glu/hydantoin racemase